MDFATKATLENELSTEKMIGCCSIAKRVRNFFPKLAAPLFSELNTPEKPYRISYALWLKETVFVPLPVFGD
jgi:hypothetical protein